MPVNQYESQAKSEGIDPVRRQDRKAILAYLRGDSGLNTPLLLKRNSEIIIISVLAPCKQFDTGIRLVRPTHRPPPKEVVAPEVATPVSGKDGDNTSVCRDFLRNVCSRGSKCRFSHVKEDGTEPGSNSKAKKDSFSMQDTVR